MNSPRLLPAGPHGHPVMGHYIPFRDDALGLFEDIAHQYGDVARIRFGPQQVVVVNTPGLAKELFHDRRRFVKGGIWSRMRPMLGKGLLTNEGTDWQHQRRLMVPAFHAKRLARLTEHMTCAAQEVGRRWDKTPDGQIDVHHDMMELALEVAVRALFSTTVTEDTHAIARAFTELQKHILRRLWSFNPLTGHLPTARNKRFDKALEVLDSVVMRIIAEHRKEGVDHGDLLSMMLQVRDDNGQGMNDQQVRDEVMTIVLAGHETTANAMSWCWYLLDKHPQIAQKVRAEIHEVLGQRAPTYEDLPRLTYTRDVIRETMRLYPPIWLIPRTTTEDTTLGPYNIAKGTIVMALPYLLHRHPRYWNNPERFEPERWAKDHDRPRYTFMPFGAGPRMCLGKHFAMMEAQIALTTLLRGRQVKIDADHIPAQPLLSLRPHRGRMTAHVTAQRASNTAQPTSPALQEL